MKVFRYLIIGCLCAAVVFATKIQFSNQYIFHDIGIHDPDTPYWKISKIQNNFSNTHFAVLTPETRLRLIHHQFTIYIDSGDSVLNYTYRYRYYLYGETAPEWTVLAPHYFGQFIHDSGFWYGLWSLDSVNLFQLPLDTGRYCLEFSHTASVVGTGGDTLTKTYILPNDLPFCAYFRVCEPQNWGYEDSARSIVLIQQDGAVFDSLYLWNFGFGDGDEGFFNGCHLGSIGQDGSLYLEDLHCRTWGNVDACSYFYRIYEESAVDTPAFSVIPLEQNASDIWSGDSLHIPLTADRAIGSYYLEIYGCISHNDSVQGDLFDCPENDVYRAMFDINSEGQGAEPASSITLNFLHAEATNGIVELTWETASETENAHFLVYRDGDVIAQITGAGTTTEPHNYNYTDT
ncbi:MAG: hypothetical protein KAT14_01230, partial [Candidatus Marinimicrobia bacterium]|nr:hypothetical protein [Candidatus Neomarinimicrobiota bacterium]